MPRSYTNSFLALFNQNSELCLATTLDQAVLQTVFKNKIGHAFSKGKFKLMEDTLTSSVIGLMQYLPDDLFWRILQAACGRASNDLPEKIGQVTEFHFWHIFNNIGRKVEPDVWIETNEYDIIIEAKKSDNSSDNAQWEKQWEDQILSLCNSYEGEKPKPLIYIAIGGNDSLRDTTLKVEDQEYVIHTASWYNLLNCVLNELNSTASESISLPIRRILQDIVHALGEHHIIKTLWFTSLLKTSVTAETNISLNEIWDFDVAPQLSAIQHIQITNDIDLSKIWIIAK